MTTEAPAYQFEAVFHALYERVARAIARIVRDPARAEELAVEVFCKLWRTPPERADNIEAWVHRTAVRLALDELRRQKRQEKYERLVAWFSKPSTPQELQGAREEQERVRTVLASIDARYAEMLVLRADGQSYAQVAATLHLNPASVGTLLSRAQEAFRKEYVNRYGR